MTLPTPSSSNQNSENSQIKQNLNQSEPQKVSLLGRNEPPLKSRKQVSKGGTWSFSSKAMIGAIAVSTIPVLAVGILTYSMVRSLRQQVIQTGQSEGPVLAETENNFDRQLGLLLLGTAVTAGLAGAIAIFMTRRTVNPVLQGTAMTNKLVDQLRRQEANTFNSQARPDDLGSLQSNLSIIEERLPELIWKQEAETERYQILMDIIQQMRKARSEEEVLRLAVTGIRQAFQTDRIGIFRFNTSSWEGSFVEESVAPGFPKALWSTIKDPCFEGHAQEYAQGRIHAIDNIYEAELGDCYITLLERFAVKANLVAPIMQDDQLFGLLIGHQCTGPRLWQQHEIDLFAQLATQVGLALERARLLEQFDMKATRSQVFIEITHNIRASLIEEDILEATVYQVRKELWCDRVIVYHFSEDWYGTVVAESVLPGCPKALYAKIKDPCFEEGYVEQYKAGRVQAINNVHEAGLTECHLKQLEPFGVKASLIAPIVKDNHLFGLLIAHECAAPRNWQPWEIDLFTQIATQVGFALDHARLLGQVDRDYQSAQGLARQEQQQNQALNHQVSTFFEKNQTVVEILSNRALNQMESVTLAYQQMQEVADLSKQMMTTAQQAEEQLQQANHRGQTEQALMKQVGEKMVAIQETIIASGETIQQLRQPCEKLSQIMTGIEPIISQLKLQSMKAQLGAGRTGESGREIATLAQKIHALVQELGKEFGEISPVLAEVQGKTQKVTTAIETELDLAITGCQLNQDAQQAFEHMARANSQLTNLVNEIVEAAATQRKNTTSASQSVLEMADLTSQTSEQFLSMSNSFNQLVQTEE